MSKKTKKKKGPSYTPPVINRIFSREKGRCYWCNKGLRLKHSATKDHVLPRSKGGTNDMFNLVLSCGRCNNYKSNDLINPVTKQAISPSVLWVFLKEVRECGV